MSAVLIHSHSLQPQFYRLIPELCCAINTFAVKKAEDALSQLGPILLKHGMCDKYGLTMIHRHFDMGQGELLVEGVNGDRSVSVAMPWKIETSDSDLKLAPSDPNLWQSFELEEQPFVEPNTWAFNEHGVLVPFEFHTTNDPIREEMPEEFVSELFTELKKLGLESVFGLRRVRHAGASYETTPEGMRANVTKFGGPPPDSDPSKFVKVVFRIGPDGKVQVNAWCGSCCSTCHNCYGTRTSVNGIGQH